MRAASREPRVRLAAWLGALPAAAVGRIHHRRCFVDWFTLAFLPYRIPAACTSEDGLHEVESVPASACDDRRAVASPNLEPLPFRLAGRSATMMHGTALASE
jgi:hypothetical protein